MSNETPSEDLAMMIVRTAFMMRAQADDVARNLGVTSLQGRVLAFIEAQDNGEVIQRDLCDRTGMAPASVTRMLIALEEDGYVERRGSATDSRRKTLHLKPKAHKLLKSFRDDTDAYAQTLLTALTVSEQKTLAKLLTKIQTTLQEQK